MYYLLLLLLTCSFAFCDYNVDIIIASEFNFNNLRVNLYDCVTSHYALMKCVNQLFVCSIMASGSALKLRL